ncbi:FtsX-like permease family protein [Eubacterium oxidoreducens]|nr:FtsX-like permease family protein [Eubacterium oxidoreducens]
MGNLEEKSLDNTVIFPFSTNRLVKMGDVSAYDMGLSSLIIVSENEEQVEKFVEEIAQTDTFSIDYVKLSQSLESIVDYYKPQIEYEIMLSAIVFIFAVFSIVSNIIIMINNNIREYAIHMYCGAKTIDIVKRIMMQMLLIMIVALLPILFVFSIKVGLMIILLEIISLCGICALVVRYLKKIEYNSILRGL